MNASLVAGKQSLDAEIIDGKTLSALNEDRLKMLRLLSRQPRYPAELARELGMQEQTAYYHMRILVKAGLVELVDYKQKQGALAKRFKARASALAVTLSDKWRPVSSVPTKKPPKLFAPFVKNSFFDALFILGSPDPHGEYRGRGSEYPAAELAMNLGQYASFSYPLYRLDTEVEEHHKKENLFALGGPKVNAVVNSLNPHLPIKFAENTFDITSSLSGKKYSENVGIVELVTNPFNKQKKVLVVSGRDHNSTRVAVLSIITKREKLEKGNTHDSSVLAKVVQGFDEDADGIVDAVEILE
ncbi:MAG: S-layer protein [Candidatus Micrarchaeia archaeon]